jgi:PAS domain S-box-containing protein
VIPEKGYLECVMADMTDEKLAAEALRRERDFAQRLLETAHAIVMVLGLTGRVLRINRYARDVTGLAESDVLGRDWFELFAPQDQRSELRQVFMKVVDGWRSVGTERRLETRRGTLAVQWYVSALRDQDGKAVGLMVIGHDITEIRTKEQQLRDAAKMEAVGRLAGGIAHDFNNQLTIIKGYCDLLLRRFEGDASVEKPLGSIVSAAMTASSLTRELLMFSRKHTLNPRVVDVNRMLTDVADPIERVLGADVDLQLELDDELGAVKLDPVQFEQAMINLAANARDAMPDGGRLTICTENTRVEEGREDATAGPYTKITIADTGVGMTEETAEQIFEPFFSTKPEGTSSGMALASAYGFVKQSGGWIDVKSQPGQGTEFEMYLPQLEERDLAREAGEQREPMAANDRTILVVEDSEAVREIVTRVLGESGYRVLQAPNARKALPILEEDGEEIDLLVTDVIMPGMTGVELAHEAKRRWPDLPILYISGYVGERLSQQGLDTDRHNLLQKPFEAGDLTRAVKRLLQESDAGSG